MPRSDAKMLFIRMLRQDRIDSVRKESTTEMETVGRKESTRGMDFIRGKYTIVRK